LAQPRELHGASPAGVPPAPVPQSPQKTSIPLMWGIVVLVGAVLIAVVTYVIAGQFPAEYKSSTSLVVQVSGANPNEAATAANTVASQFAQDLTGEAVIAQASRRLSAADAKGLSGAVSGGTVAAQNVVQIIASGSSPGQAQRRAAAVSVGLTKYAHALVETQAKTYARAARAQLAPISAQIATVTAALSKIPASEQTSGRAISLQGTLSTLVSERATASAAIAQQATGGEPTIALLDKAPPGGKTAPKPALYAAAAFVLALLLLWRLIVFVVPRQRD
jgi:capsular polysaccharide biosynthesis protein